MKTNNKKQGPLMKIKSQPSTAMAISPHGNIRIFHVPKYVVDISAQKSHRLPVVLTLNTKSIKNIFLFLAVLCVTLTNLKADFTSLPIMQEFEYVVSEDDAISQLFNGQDYKFSKNNIISSQAKSTYTVMVSEKKFFVKIIREDCKFCNQTSFNYEFELKNDKQKNYLMKTVNAELVLPSVSATFMLEGTKHLIMGYPWAPGITLSNIYMDHFLGSKTSEILQKAMYRYGQVLAAAALDQNDPNDDIENLLNRTPQILLDDRHGGNTKYFERNDKIYLLDLSTIHLDKFSDTVKMSIVSNYVYINGFLTELIASDRSNMTIIDEVYIYEHGRGEYLSLPFSQFIAGYISALPNYDPDVVKIMLLQKIDSMFAGYCEAGLNLYCDLIEVTYSMNTTN
ncbi:MAG: hypothetical protein QS748_11230 [Candidatus Endonucleobacter bathymodioli]|uniref:Uncharacterized protein n=1 Tax=Candidatus Endonucleibacter bathymodioli TaxID=539814 RepID=A0AA90NMV3_9GAMM|nr:hypothetical protein [Candidatus Endonucleobacter bathymodioli]